MPSGRDEALIAALAEPGALETRLRESGVALEGSEYLSSQLDKTGQRVVLLLRRPETLLTVRVGPDEIEVRDLRDDPQLTTLPRLLERYPGARVLRYRPEKRCTLFVPGSPHGPAIAKVFPNEAGERMDALGRLLEEAAQRGRIAFRVAPMLGFNRRDRVHWQGFLPGRAVASALFSSRGPELASRMGRANGTLASSGLQLASQLDGFDQMERSRRYAKRLARLAPRLAATCDALIERLQERHRSDVGRVRVRAPIHGSPHAHQWLEGDGTRDPRLGLVDFDRAAMGDPELDVATFLAEVDYEDPRAPLGQICDAYRAGYESAAGPLDSAILDGYRAHKHLSKAARAVRSARPDGTNRAERALTRGLRLLDGAH